MTVTAQTLAIACGDSYVRIHGEGTAGVDRIASLTSLRPGALLFVNKSDVDLAPILSRLGSGIIIATAPVNMGTEVPSGCAIIECVNARLSFARCARAYFCKETLEIGIHPTAVIGMDTVIAPSAWIGANCYVGNRCSIGERSKIFPNVTIFDDCNIGAHVTINAGTVIGADGYGYEQNAQGKYEKFPHTGGVVVEDDVEIGANTCIDRGVLEDTIVRRGVKIDNLVHVAHNVEIGENAMIIACCMIGGSVRIGARAWVAPAVTIINQKHIGMDAIIGLGAVVTKDVADGQTVMGAPALDQAEFRARSAAVKKLLI
jgi:UDP-3-O-[3-hydroxymyristoyl] glucosamine N-acyltransferase